MIKRLNFSPKRSVYAVDSIGSVWDFETTPLSASAMLKIRANRIAGFFFSRVIARLWSCHFAWFWKINFRWLRWCCQFFSGRISWKVMNDRIFTGFNECCRIIFNVGNFWEPYTMCRNDFSIELNSFQANPSQRFFAPASWNGGC